jgi:hypothetical protein
VAGACNPSYACIQRLVENNSYVAVGLRTRQTSQNQRQQKPKGPGK